MVSLEVDIETTSVVYGATLSAVDATRSGPGARVRVATGIGLSDMETGASHTTAKLSTKPGVSPRVNVRLPADVLDKLDDLAAKQGRKRSDLIRSIPEESVAA